MKIVYVIGIGIILMLYQSISAAQQSPMQWQPLITGIEHRVIERRYSDKNSDKNSADSVDDGEVRQVRLHAFRIQQGLFTLSIHSFQHLYEDERVSVDDYRQQKKALMVLSGGFFQASFREPVGLVVEGGWELFPVTKSLSGVVWIKNGKLHLSETKRFQQQAIKADYAVQGYPRIVDPINKRGIKTQRSLFRHRAALCSVKDHFIIIISDKQFSGLSLYEFATIAQQKEANDGLACDIAINLDGGPASALSIDKQRLKLNVEVKERIGWQVPNVIVVSPKTSKQ